MITPDALRDAYGAWKDAVGRQDAMMMEVMAGALLDIEAMEVQQRELDAFQAAWIEMASQVACVLTPAGIDSDSPERTRRIVHDPDNRRPHDRTSIDLNHDVELGYWMQKLGVTEEVLRMAVAAAGTSVAAVKDHLGMK